MQSLTPTATATASAAAIAAEKLLAEIAAGNLLAFEQLMRTHNRRLFRVARSILKCDGDAEDAVQEAYLRAFVALKSYQGAAQLLGVGFDEVLMVAAHPSDLRGAARAGLRTALVRRLLEYGPNPTGKPPPDALPDDHFDVVATDFVDLARQLGA